MTSREYLDFDDLFLNINKEILQNPWMLNYANGISGYIDNLFISCDSWKCNLDLSAFGYTIDKWGKLLRTYVDYDELKNFYKKLECSSGLSLTYYFKQKKVNNGSCLIGIVLSRKNRKKKWSKVNVIYRTTELQRRFAADLVLIHHFINELPEECEIEEVTFYMAQSYISAMVINGYYDYFNVPMNSLDDSHPWIKSLISVYKRSFVEGSRITTFKSKSKMQKLRMGLISFEKIPINSLGIKEFFEGGK